MTSDDIAAALRGTRLARAAMDKILLDELVATRDAVREALAHIDSGRDPAGAVAALRERVRSWGGLAEAVDAAKGGER